MKSNIVAFVFVIFSIIFSSCGDDGSPPVITFNSPAELETFSIGDTLALRATIVDDESLSSLNLIAPGINETITNFDTPSSHSYNVGLVVSPLFPQGNLEFTLIATDNEGMSSSFKRTVVIQE